MKANSIAFAVYPVSDIKRARKFYEGSLGLKAARVWVSNNKSGMIEYDIGPDTLAIGAGASNFKLGNGKGVSVAIEVDDFNKTLEMLKSKKVKLLMKPYDGPICQMTLVADPDGNKIVIHQRKKKQSK